MMSVAPTAGILLYPSMAQPPLRVETFDRPEERSARVPNGDTPDDQPTRIHRPTPRPQRSAPTPSKAGMARLQETLNTIGALDPRNNNPRDAILHQSGGLFSDNEQEDR